MSALIDDGLVAAVLGNSDSDDDSALRAVLNSDSTPVKRSFSAGADGSSRRLLLSPSGLGGGPATPTLTVRVMAPVEGCELKPFVRARLPLTSILSQSGAAGGAGSQPASAEAIAASVVTEADPRLVFEWAALRLLPSGSAKDVTDDTDASLNLPLGLSNTKAGGLSLCANSCCPGHDRARRQGSSNGSSLGLGRSDESLPGAGRSSGSTALYSAAVVSSITGGSVDGFGWDGIGTAAGLHRVLDCWAASEAAAAKAAAAVTLAAKTGPTRGKAPARPVAGAKAGSDAPGASPARGDPLVFRCAVCDGGPRAAAVPPSGGAEVGAPTPLQLDAPGPLSAPEVASPHNCSSADASGGRPFTFCSLRCLLAGWREHAQYHASSGGAAAVAASLPVGGAPSFGAESAPPGYAWVRVCSGATYTPGPADVGRPLRLTVTLPTPAGAAGSSGSSAGGGGLDGIGRALDFTSAASGSGSSGGDSGSDILAAGRATPSPPPPAVLTQTSVTLPVRPYPPGPPPRSWVHLAAAGPTVAQAHAAAAAAAANGSGSSDGQASSSPTGGSGSGALRPPPGLRAPPPGLPIPAKAQPSPTAGSSSGNGSVAAASGPAIVLPNGGIPLRVLCWNVLADVYATGQDPRTDGSPSFRSTHTRHPPRSPSSPVSPSPQRAPHTRRRRVPLRAQLGPRVALPAAAHPLGAHPARPGPHSAAGALTGRWARRWRFASFTALQAPFSRSPYTRAFA